MKKIAFLLTIMATGAACSQTDEAGFTQAPVPEGPVVFNYLALGDSYTIGESVCETCRFPAQLKAAIENNKPATVNLKVIARTGWTTSNLIEAIKTESPANNQNLVTLLIGVNNQYQNKPFELYEKEFPELLQTAITLAEGRKDKVIVVSIPDYSYTPFGQSTTDPEKISLEIDAYNAYAAKVCNDLSIDFVGITDITRNGLEDPELVATDGLHPSEKAYARFVERLLPLALAKLNN